MSSDADGPKRGQSASYQTRRVLTTRRGQSVRVRETCRREEGRARTAILVMSRGGDDKGRSLASSRLIQNQGHGRLDGGRGTVDDMDRTERIGAFVVQRGRNVAVFKGQQSRRHFHCPPSGTQVSKVALQRCNRRIAQAFANHLCFGCVVLNGAQAVSIDMADL